MMIVHFEGKEDILNIVYNGAKEDILSIVYSGGKQTILDIFLVQLDSISNHKNKKCLNLLYQTP